MTNSFLPDIDRCLVCPSRTESNTVLYKSRNGLKPYKLQKLYTLIIFTNAIKTAYNFDRNKITKTTITSSQHLYKNNSEQPSKNKYNRLKIQQSSRRIYIDTVPLLPPPPQAAPMVET